MQLKEIEDWAKPKVDYEVDSEIHSRLIGKCHSDTTFQALEKETQKICERAPGYRERTTYKNDIRTGFLVFSAERKK